MHNDSFFRRFIIWPFTDIVAVTKRNLIRYKRVPQLIIFSTIQPVMFVLLFAFVFGGAINIPGVEYIDYLLPGILVQAVIFGSIQTGVGLAVSWSVRGVRLPGSGRYRSGF